MDKNKSRKETIESIMGVSHSGYFTEVDPTQWNFTDFASNYKEIEGAKPFIQSIFKNNLVLIDKKLSHDDIVEFAIERLNESLSICVADSEKASSNCKVSMNEAKLLRTLQRKSNANTSRAKKAGSGILTEALEKAEGRHTKRLRSSGVSSSSSSASSITTTESVDESIQDEGDNGNCDNELHESVSASIKNAATELLDKVMNGQELTSRERKILRNGLSSILDLNDSSFNSQLSLFKDVNHCNFLIKLFQKKYPIHSAIIPSEVASNIYIAMCTSKKFQTLKKGFPYIIETYYKVDESNRYILDIFSHMVKCIEKYPDYLIKDPPFEISENDYLRILWSPIYESLFTFEGSKIRVICSESRNPSTTDNKSNSHSNCSNIEGRKIEIRVVCRLDDVDYDLLTGDVASHDGDDMDEGKLIRKGKEIQDFFVDLGLNDLFPWIIHHAGPSMDVSSLHKISLELYVVNGRFSFSLPSNLSELLDNGPRIIQDLLTLRTYILKMALPLELLFSKS